MPRLLHIVFGVLKHQTTFDFQDPIYADSRWLHAGAIKISLLRSTDLVPLDQDRADKPYVC
jgi:hypothetical protein